MLDFCIFWSSSVREWYTYFVCYWVGGVLLSLFLWINTLDHLLWLLKCNLKIHLQESVRIHFMQICQVAYQTSKGLPDFFCTMIPTKWWSKSGRKPSLVQSRILRFEVLSRGVKVKDDPVPSDTIQFYFRGSEDKPEAAPDNLDTSDTTGEDTSSQHIQVVISGVKPNCLW